MALAALVLVVATALHAHRAHAGVDVRPSQVSGAWRTEVIMADDPEKIREGGALRGLFRRVTMAPDGATVDLEFFIRNDSECERHEVLGRRTEDGKFSTDYSGKNFFEIAAADGGRLVFYDENVDGRGRRTRLVLVAGKGQGLTAEEEGKFRALAEEKGIPSPHVENVLDSGGGGRMNE
ncbi:odorant-binding protein-like [Perognathus longimembris pacificus]|uniref:odorant-binding protein-like n=1 Tax=Perognathus longimembris pacificus TaxID=214514 RepID=UPI00201984D4|nr:odorant-binding protein-like [Perognathus longimembris pacificus]